MANAVSDKFPADFERFLTRLDAGGELRLNPRIVFNAVHFRTPARAKRSGDVDAGNHEYQPRDVGELGSTRGG
jgi:hypothetical protein